VINTLVGDPLLAPWTGAPPVPRSPAGRPQPPPLALLLEAPPVILYDAYVGDYENASDGQ
jgi:hypothetical protein